MANVFPSRGRRCVAARNNLVAPLGTLSGPCHLRKRVAGDRGLWYTESYQKGGILIELLSNS